MALTDVGAVPVVNATSGGGDGMFGGSMITILLIFALLSGGLCGNRNGSDGVECGRNEHQHMDTREEIRFNEASTQAQMNTIASNDWQKSILMEICDTDKIIMNGNTANLAATADAKYDNALMLKDMALDNFKCCCETQKQMAEGFNAVMRQNDQNVINQYRDQWLLGQVQNSQLTQNQFIRDEVNPRAKPAWIACNPMAMGGCNTGCGNF